MIHLYIGNGKGKTTAAVGLAVRAIGAGKKVLFAQFLKGIIKTSEIKSLEALGVDVKRFSQKHPDFCKNVSVEKLKKDIVSDLDSVIDLICTKKYDLIILDEILCALKCDFIEESKILEFLKLNAKTKEIVLTGHITTAKISRMADYVSCIEKVKHPFDKSIKARKGIEY